MKRLTLFVLLFSSPVLAQLSPAERAALGRARVLDIRGKVLDIKGISRGIEGKLRELDAKVTDREIRIQLSADVLFDFDKAELKPEAAAQLEKVAAVLREYPDAPVRIDGHTDSKGKRDYNQKLSEARALAVRDWLSDTAEIPPDRMTTQGWAESKPVAPNTKPDGSDDPEGRQKNRRVEITVLKTEKEG